MGVFSFRSNPVLLREWRSIVRRPFYRAPLFWALAVSLACVVFTAGQHAYHWRAIAQYGEWPLVERIRWLPPEGARIYWHGKKNVVFLEPSASPTPQLPGRLYVYGKIHTTPPIDHLSNDPKIYGHQFDTRRYCLPWFFFPVRWIITVQWTFIFVSLLAPLYVLSVRWAAEKRIGVREQLALTFISAWDLVVEKALSCFLVFLAALGAFLFVDFLHKIVLIVFVYDKEPLLNVWNLYFYTPERSPSYLYWGEFWARQRLILWWALGVLVWMLLMMGVQTWMAPRKWPPIVCVSIDAVFGFGLLMGLFWPASRFLWHVLVEYKISHFPQYAQSADIAPRPQAMAMVVVLAAAVWAGAFSNFRRYFRPE